MKPVGTSLLAVAIAAVSIAAARPSDRETWFVVATADGQTIGYASQRTEQIADGRRITDYQEVTLAQRGGPTRSAVQNTARTEDAAGRTRTVETSTRTGKAWTRSEAVIVGDQVRIVRTTAFDRRVTTIPLQSGTRFDGGEGLLARWDPATTPRLTFEAFDIDIGAAERVVLEAPPGAQRDAEGRLPVLRKRYQGDSLIGISRLLVDRDGRIVSTAQRMLDAGITTRQTDKATALAPHAPYWPLSDAMIKSPFRIPPSAARGHIRYRFGFQEGIDFAPPATGEQRARPSASGMNVDICGDCGPGLPSDAAYLADALKPTAWLQSDHPKLRRVSASVARMRVSDARKMELLQKKAARYLKDVDFSGHYSALETLSRKRGDCTEAAVLLAALGRSAGIPTRVVNGLVYSRERYHGVSHAFMPHSWTIAFVDDEWRSFDLALDEFDSTHIALTVGDGDPRSVLAAGQLASLLVWEGMTEVRARPSS